jgi:hypothetical protein
LATKAEETKRLHEIMGQKQSIEEELKTNQAEKRRLEEELAKKTEALAVTAAEKSRMEEAMLARMAWMERLEDHLRCDCAHTAELLRAHTAELSAAAGPYRMAHSEKKRLEDDVAVRSEEKRRLDEALAERAAEVQRLDEELATKKCELERVDVALGSKTCQLRRDDAIQRKMDASAPSTPDFRGRAPPQVPPLELRGVQAEELAWERRRGEEECDLKAEEKRSLEHALSKEVALLKAELEGQRLEKLQMERPIVLRSPRYVHLPATTRDTLGDSSALLHFKDEIERLKGEISTGYKFVKGLSSLTSRSSNSAGESPRPCSSRTGNTYTPRTGTACTPRIGNSCTPRNASHGNLRQLAAMLDNSTDPPTVPALDLDAPEAYASRTGCLLGLLPMVLKRFLSVPSIEPRSDVVGENSNEH